MMADVVRESEILWSVEVIVVVAVQTGLEMAKSGSVRFLDHSGRTED